MQPRPLCSLNKFNFYKTNQSFLFPPHLNLLMPPATICWWRGTLDNFLSLCSTGPVRQRKCKRFVQGQVPWSWYWRPRSDCRFQSPYTPCHHVKTAPTRERPKTFLNCLFISPNFFSIYCCHLHSLQYLWKSTHIPYQQLINPTLSDSCQAWNTLEKGWGGDWKGSK